MKEGWRGKIADLMLNNQNAEALALVRQAIEEGRCRPALSWRNLGNMQDYPDKRPTS